jgi:hypothetical protein
MYKGQRGFKDKSGDPVTVTVHQDCNRRHCAEHRLPGHAHAWVDPDTGNGHVRQRQFSGPVEEPVPHADRGRDRVKHLRPERIPRPHRC